MPTGKWIKKVAPQHQHTLAHSPGCNNKISGKFFFFFLVCLLPQNTLKFPAALRFSAKSPNKKTALILCELI